MRCLLSSKPGSNDRNVGVDTGWGRRPIALGIFLFDGGLAAKTAGFEESGVRESGRVFASATLDIGVLGVVGGIRFWDVFGFLLLDDGFPRGRNGSIRGVVALGSLSISA